jgi:selenocysteine lyase/cysteine desulfurase
VDSLAQIRALFEPAPDTIYLDAATFGLPPRPTVEAMHRAIDAWRSGSADWVQAWDRKGEICRAAFAALIGADPTCVTLQPSVSVSVGLIAQSLAPGDEVVVPDDEFTSVLFPILVTQRQRGLKVRAVPFAQIADHVGSSTSMVAFSLVQSQSGRVADLRAILEASRSVGAKTLVDATHALPFVSMAENLPRIDYLVCAAYKHLLCPRGVSFAYVARERWDALAPLNANWRSTPDPYAHYYGGPLALAPDAARFDVSLAWFCWAGAAVSLALLADWQRDGVLDHVLGLSSRLAQQLGLPAPKGSVLSVSVDEADKVRLELSAAGIKAAVRAGSVRVSPHVYNTADQIDRAAAALARFVRQPAGR